MLKQSLRKTIKKTNGKKTPKRFKIGSNINRKSEAKLLGERPWRPRVPREPPGLEKVTLGTPNGSPGAPFWCSRAGAVLYSTFSVFWWNIIHETRNVNFSALVQARGVFWWFQCRKSWLDGHPPGSILVLWCRRRASFHIFVVSRKLNACYAECPF